MHVRSLLPQVFAHRDAYEQVVSKTEEKLQRARVDYKRAYAALLTNDGSAGAEQELKRVYLESHNAYILQLRATNAITERYQFHCLPGLLGEIAEVYEELCGLTCKCVAGIAEAFGERTGEQTKRYQAVAKEAQAVVPSNDLQVCPLPSVKLLLNGRPPAVRAKFVFILFSLRSQYALALYTERLLLGNRLSLSLSSFEIILQQSSHLPLHTKGRQNMMLILNMCLGAKYCSYRSSEINNVTMFRLILRKVVVK